MNIRLRNIDWSAWKLPGYFMLVRLLVFITLPLEGLLGYGDFHYFFDLAALGIPYRQIWYEYPPIFPFLSRGLYIISGAQRHVYVYLIVTLLSISQALCLYFFQRIANQLYPSAEASNRSFRYLILLVGFAYSWWNFDPLANLAIIAGVCWLMENRQIHSAAIAAFGTLIKVFPALLFVLVWRYRNWKAKIWMSLLWFVIVFGVLGYFYWQSPEYVRASLELQASRGSWETVWALIDGNIGTGNLGLLEEHRIPAYASQLDRNPSRIPAWVTLPIFGLLGLFLFIKAKTPHPPGQLALLGLTWCIFFLWSPAWSPQWVLYLLPWILLLLPVQQAWLYAIALVMVNILEWPVLLSRGIFQALWLTIILRTVLIAMLAWSFWKVIRNPENSENLEGE